MRYRWGFNVPNNNLMDGLSYNFHSPDVAIMRDEEDAMPPVFFWTSQHFNELEKGDELAKRAAALKRLFDGSLYLVNGMGYFPERLGYLVDLQADRMAGSLEFPATPTNPFSPTVCKQLLDGNHKAAVQNKITAGSLYAARTDAVVFGMLNLLGARGITFGSLYSLRDFMKTHGMTDDMIATSASCTASEINLFAHTANNFDASGADARHGDLGHQPPSIPMTLERASEIVLKAVHSFISGRVILATANL
jgi:hypothetical protein